MHADGMQEVSWQMLFEAPEKLLQKELTDVQARTHFTSIGPFLCGIYLTSEAPALANWAIKYWGTGSSEKAWAEAWVSQFLETKISGGAYPLGCFAEATFVSSRLWEQQEALLERERGSMLSLLQSFRSRNILSRVDRTEEGVPSPTLPSRWYRPGSPSPFTLIVFLLNAAARSTES